MKNMLFISVTCILLGSMMHFPAQAQKRKKNEQEIIQLPDFPVDESTGLITYSEVVHVQGSKDDLYKKGLDWFNAFYRNASNVIKKKDQESGIISGKPKFRIYIENPDAGVKSNAGTVLYTINLQFKEGRYRYEISKLTWVKSSPYPVEKWIEENKKKYSYAYASYLLQTHQYMDDLINNLKEHMSAVPKAPPADW